MFQPPVEPSFADSALSLWMDAVVVPLRLSGNGEKTILSGFIVPPPHILTLSAGQLVSVIEPFFLPCPSQPLLSRPMRWSVDIVVFNSLFLHCKSNCKPPLPISLSCRCRCPTGFTCGTIWPFVFPTRLPEPGFVTRLLLLPLCVLASSSLFCASIRVCLIE